MSTSRRSPANVHDDAGGANPDSGGISSEKSFFEQERTRLVTEISLALEHVLMNLNVLNRSLEGVTSVGREFESVEMLWSQFEGVMGGGSGMTTTAAGTAGAGGSGGGGSGTTGGAGAREEEEETITEGAERR